MRIVMFKADVVDREDFKTRRSFINRQDHRENTDRKTKDNERSTEKARGYIRSIIHTHAPHTKPTQPMRRLSYARKNSFSRKCKMTVH